MNYLGNSIGDVPKPDDTANAGAKLREGSNSEPLYRIGSGKGYSLVIPKEFVKDIPKQRELGEDSLKPDAVLQEWRQLRRPTTPQTQARPIEDLFPALWWQVARFNDQKDCAALIQCRSSLVGSLDAQALWHHYAIECGIASLPWGSDAQWIYPYQPDVQVDRCVDWRLLLQVNRCATGMHAVSVRIRDVDLRVPLSSQGGKGKDKKQHAMSQLTRDLDALIRIRRTVDLPNKEQEVPPLRLRQLQCNGRPGPLLYEESSTSMRGSANLHWGGRVLVEWALPSGAWPLPPHHALPLAATPFSSGVEQAPRSPSFSTSRFELPIFTRLHRQMSLTSATSVSSNGSAQGTFNRVQSMDSLNSFDGDEDDTRLESLLHVESCLLSEDFWLPVDLKGTVESLSQAVAKALVDRCPELGNCDVRLVEPRVNGRDAVRLSDKSKQLRQIGWCQCESVRLELAESLDRRGDFVRKSTLGVTAVAAIAAAEENGRCIVMMVREPTFIDLATHAAAEASKEACAAAFNPCPHFDAIPRRPWLTEDILIRRRCGLVASQDAQSESSSLGLGLSLCLRRMRRQETAPALVRNTPHPEIDSITAEELDVPWSRSWTEPPVFHRQISDPVTSAISEESSISTSPRSTAAGSTSDSTQAADERQPVPGLVHDSTNSPRDDAGSSGGSSEGTRIPDERTTVSRSWKERIMPHYPPTLLPRAMHARQFEFHSSSPDLMLVGDKLGNVNVLNVESDADYHPPLAIDTFAVLGLAWMQRHPQSAVCGAAGSGKIAFLRYDPHAANREPLLKPVCTVEEFPKLTSLSVNCSDDFLVATGMSRSLVVYDVCTGKVLHKDHQIHDHFVNTGRFCSTDPHLFCTASFDHTCKIWDLRQPLGRDRAVRTLNTGGQNVMCVFSPDDRHLLASGVDTRLVQYDIGSWRQTPQNFNLREAQHPGRYRRSMYLVDSPHIVTAATEESHLHVMSVTDGESLGVVDFRGVVKKWLHEGERTPSMSGSDGTDGRIPMRRTSDAARGNALSTDVSGLRSSLGTVHSPSAARSGFASRWAQCIPRAPWIRPGPSWRRPGLVDGDGSRAERSRTGWQESGSIVQGELELRESPNGNQTFGQQQLAAGREAIESVQSMRTHPMIKNRVGVLLCLPQAYEQTSVIALLHLDASSLGWEG